MVRAWYESGSDDYIIDFSADPAFPIIDSREDQSEKWGMFTHGICAPVVNKHFEFFRIAITGRHLSDPLEATLSDRIEQAARRLRHMGEEAEAQVPGSLSGRQCLKASEILKQERDALLRALLALQQAHVTSADEGPTGNCCERTRV